ncbi:MAG: lysylphosphatidylglycerol synthase transmembrane domain-containing protein, partial [Bacteroidota bacterium]
STLNSFFSVMISYFANLALPRFGEVTRAIVIKKYEKIPFTESFGTIVLERIIDLFALFILTGIVLIFRFDVLSGFIRHNPAAGDKFADFEFSYTWIIYFAALLILGTGGFLILRHKIRHTVFYKKISDLVRKFLDGIKSIKKIKNLPAFLLHTVFIWTMYFMMLYVTFFAFDFTNHLTPFTALIVFVFASYGMVAPVQGGIGAWHFMVIGTLAVFQIGNEEAGIFAFVVHGAQTLMLVVLGLISFIGMPVFNKIKQHDNIRKDSQ